MLAVTCSLGLVPVALLGYQVARTLSKDLAAQQKEAQLDKTEAVAGEIARLVKESVGRLTLIADALAHVVPDVPGQGLDHAVAEGLLARYVGQEGVLELRLLDTTTGDVALRSRPTSFDSDVIAKHVEPEMAIAVHKGARGLSYLSNPFLPGESPQHVLVVASVPVRQDETSSSEARWVLAALVSMSVVQGYVQEASSDTGDTLFVLDDQFRPFAHTQYMRVVEGRPLEGDVLVEEFKENSLSLAASAASLEFVQEDPVTGERHEMIGTYRPVTLDLHDHRWGVFVEVDRKAGLYPVQALWRTTLTWSIVAFALAVVIGMVFSWRITDPIHDLTESTRRVASGEYGRVVRVRSNDEIGMLADNFNLMSQQVRRTIDELQEQHEINDQLFIASIRSLAAAIDARDPYTRGHSDRVRSYARAIARQIGLAPDQVRNIEIGALLHDVGKIGIEDRILRKPAALTPEEFEIMKTHPEKGGDIMAPISYLRDATETIVHHHERWDGTGYPSGLKGEEIPLGARIVAVADTFDAMTTNRPYQRAMTFAVAAKKIGEFAGRACDPGVVSAFQASFEAGTLAPVAGENLARASEA
jgi:HD-GYP domain-containing protein (c-di-GMP phosphodiesterase class II)